MVSTRSASPRRPEPRPGSAPPTPSSSISTLTRPSPSRHGNGDAGGGGVLGDVGEGLGADEIGDHRHRRGHLVTCDRDLDRNREVLRQRRQRARQPVLGQQRADAAHAPAGAAPPAFARAGPRRGRSVPWFARRRRTVGRWRSVSASWPSRRSAPSRRRRSSRLRSSSRATRIRRRDAASSTTRACTSAWSRACEAASWAAEATASSSPGSASTAGSWTRTATGWPSRSTTVTDRPEPESGSGQHPALGVDEHRPVGQPVADLERRVAERP